MDNVKDCLSFILYRLLILLVVLSPFIAFYYVEAVMPYNDLKKRINEFESTTLKDIVYEEFEY